MPAHSLALSLLAVFAASAAQAGPPGQQAPAAVSACERDASRGLPWPLLPFGCATETNLRAVIADPADLAQGRPLSPTRGDAAFAPAERHRLGEVKPLRGDGAQSGQAPASAAAPAGGR